MDHRLVQILATFLAMIVITAAAPSSTGRLVHDIEKRNAPSDKNFCPQGDNPGFVIYADPDDCSQFFTCVHGTNVLQPCPSGLRFSNQHRVCVFPGSLEDTCGNADDHIIFPNGAMTGGDSPVNPTPTKTVNPHAAKNFCPQGDNPGFVIYADPDDCSQFFTCSNGRNILQPCAPGLRFSNQHRVCVFPGSPEDTCGNDDDHIIFPNGAMTGGKSPVNPTQTKTVNLHAAKNECPQGENPEPYLYADLDDCTKYFHCSHGVNIQRPCPSGLHFNTVHQTCVHLGSDGYQCEQDFIKRTIRRCQEGYVEVTPHPLVCQRYFNCSDNSFNELTNSPFLPYEGECEYPQVFDSVTGQCMSHKTATCAGISQAGTYVCDYLVNQCRSAHCIPCTLAPSCVGRPDGLNPHSGRPGSPYFVRCEDGFAVEELSCNAVNGATMVFSQDERRCVPT